MEYHRAPGWHNCKPIKMSSPHMTHAAAITPRTIVSQVYAAITSPNGAGTGKCSIIVGLAGYTYLGPGRGERCRVPGGQAA